MFARLGLAIALLTSACVDFKNSSFDSNAPATQATEAAPSPAATAPAVVAPSRIGPSWKLYSRTDWDTIGWTAVDVDLAWTGPNAPPPRGILAVALLRQLDRLLVWADDGRFYVRDFAGWRPPQDTAAIFPALAGRDFRGCYYSASVLEAPRSEELTLVDNPAAFIYEYTSRDAVRLLYQDTMLDEGAPFETPKASKKTRWVIRSWDVSKLGSPEYLTEYSAFDGDPYVYAYDASLRTVDRWLFAEAPPFKGTANGPPPGAIVTAWRDDTRRVSFVIAQ